MLLRAGMLGGVRFALAYEEGGLSAGVSSLRYSEGRLVGHSAEMSAVPMVSLVNRASALVVDAKMTRVEGMKRMADGEGVGTGKEVHGSEVKKEVNENNLSIDNTIKTSPEDRNDNPMNREHTDERTEIEEHSMHTLEGEDEPKLNTNENPSSTPLQSVDLFGVEMDYTPISETPTTPVDPKQSLITDLVLPSAR